MKQCPRRGYVELQDTLGETIYAGTSCNTWRCEICRWRKKQEVEDRVKYGCLTDGPYYVITITLKEGRQHWRDAKSVLEALSRLLRIVRKENYPKMRWIKVIELTKKKTPHWHLIVGGIGTPKDSCLRPERGIRSERFKNLPFSKRWLRKTCLCVSHTWSKHWDNLNNSVSYIVDAELVYQPTTIGSYLGKYLVKSFLSFNELEAMGFERRWGCSRNWPRETPITNGKRLGWVSHRIIKKTHGEYEAWIKKAVEQDQYHPTLTMHGTELGDQMRDDRQRQRAVKKNLKALRSLGNVIQDIPRST